MEVLIFGATSLFGLAVFTVITALPFIVAERLGLKLGLLTRHASLRWALPAVLLLSVLAWVLAGYFTFRRDCENIPKVQYLASPPKPPAGFKLYDEGSTWGGHTFSWSAALETGAFQFVDMAGGRRCAGIKPHERSPEFPITLQCSQHASITADFSVHVLPVKSVHYWWSPPIYVSEIRVEERKSGNVLATATDLVFGGGVVGMYLRLFGGDQDFEWLSCGYASAGIGPWRPSLTTRPRFSEYKVADVAFVNKALGVQR